MDGQFTESVDKPLLLDHGQMALAACGQFYQHFTSSFTRKDPNTCSVKIHSSCQYLLELLGSANEKAALKMLVKLTPVVNFTNIL